MNRIYHFLRNRAYRNIIYPLYPFSRVIHQPIFIVGCGRSGSTILGRLIENHFSVELHRQGGKKLIEKTPAHAFRIDYLLRISPDARFIHMVRNGVEVAHSIAQRIRLGRWYKGRKWTLQLPRKRWPSRE